ncbi:MAG TPA: hypothetical protein VFM19_11040 [Candidatus Limnocylindria bacterium]|nr:hypothetical protein [Candidatus Limnocylindria bacterium]
MHSSDPAQAGEREWRPAARVVRRGRRSVVETAPEQRARRDPDDSSAGPDPEQAVATERCAGSQRGKDLTTRRGGRRADDVEVRRHDMAVASRVLHGEDQADRTLVLLLERLTFRDCEAVLRLKVSCHPLDLDEKDLGGAEENEIRGPPAGNGMLEDASERRVGERHEVLGQRQLTRVAQ